MLFNINMLISIIILIVMTILLYFLESNVETYLNYKSNTIILSDETEKPLKISVGEKTYIYNYLNNIIKTIYPIEVINNGGGSYQNILDILRGKSDLAICQLDTAINAHQGKLPFTKESSNLRFITSVFTEKFTLLVKTNSNIYSWKDLINKRVCAGKKNWGGYYNFLNLLSISRIKESDLNIIVGDVFSEKIVKKFEDGKIDALYVTHAHPSNDIFKLYHKVRFRIIGSRGWDINLLKYRYPYIIKTSISLIDYNMSKISSNIYIETYGIPTVFVTTKRASKHSINMFIKTIFQNIEYIRNYNAPVVNKTKEVKQQFRNTFQKQILLKLLPSELLSFNSVIPLHKGAHQYYQDIGIINNIESSYCLNYAGSKNCSKVHNYKHYGHGHFVDPP
jgi:TRAP transporter TAXI family solute receptor